MMVYRIFYAAVLVLSLFGYGNTQCTSTSSITTTENTVYSLQSSNYPFGYSNYEDCKWSITAFSSANRIFFSIDTLSLELNYDFLNIYDGTSTSATRLYNSQTNTYPYPVTTTSHNAYVRFTSDYSITYGGFQIDYFEVSPSSNWCTTTLTADSTTRHAWYTSGSGCYITINAGGSNIVNITVINLSISGWTSLTFGDTDGSSSRTITEAGLSEYYSTTSSAYIQLTGYFNSFVMKYQEVASGTNNIVTTTGVDYGTSICYFSSVSATTSVDYVVSPNYPNPYPYNTYCFLLITSSNSANAVMITFVDYDVNFDDYLYIYDGSSQSHNLLGSSWSTGSSVNSTGDSLYLHFYSGYTGVLRGFRLSYREIARSLPSCATSYTNYSADTTVQIISKGLYSNYEDVFWLIVKPDESDNIVLDVTVMSIEEGISCGYDSLTFYDGSCTTDPILATVCGYYPVTFEDASGLYVLVRFQTDGSVVKDGFTLRYYIGSFITTDTEENADDDDDDKFRLYLIIAIVSVFVVAVIIAAIAIFIYYKRVKRRRTAIASGAIAAPKQKMKPKTPQQILTEISEKMKKDAEEKPKQKLTRRQTNMGKYQNQDSAPSAPGVKVITRQGQPVHPKPNAPPIPPFPPGKPGPSVNTRGGSDNPSFYQMKPEGANKDRPLDPAYPPGFDPSLYNKPLDIPEGTVPPPFTYISPNEARSFGLHE